MPPVGAACRLLYRARLLLAPYVPPDRRLVQADGAHVVPPGPQGAVPARDPAQLGVPAEQHDGRAPLELADHAAHGVLGGDPEAYVDVVDARRPLQLLDPVHLLDQGRQDLPQLAAHLAIQRLPSVFGYPDYVVQAFPTRVG